MKYLVLLLLLIAFTGCSKQTFQPINTKFPHGQKLYFSKCGGCHRLYDRTEFKPEQWDTIMISMKAKAKTTTEQEKEILLFLKERE
ncbi:MAG: hypothetical protein ACK4G1_05900 [Ignavibacteria bacterium]